MLRGAERRWRCWPGELSLSQRTRERFMDFAIPPDLAALQERTRALVRERIVPMEGDARQGAHGPEEGLRQELQAIVRREGLLAPHVSKEHGGLGLSHVGKALLFEEVGYSLLGPLAFNIAAPDEGNMHLLDVVATEAQKERWLKPLAAGAIRSCFCMTEPPPGAGSDPAALMTTAVRDGDGYVIDGRKWFTTGAVGAGFAIIMAKGEDGRATMFWRTWTSRASGWSGRWTVWTAVFRAVMLS